MRIKLYTGMWTNDCSTFHIIFLLKRELHLFNTISLFSLLYLQLYSVIYSWRLSNRNGTMRLVWLQQAIIFNLQTLKHHWAPLIDEQWLGQSVTHIIIAIVTFNWHLWGTYPSLGLIPAQDISHCLNFDFPNSLNESRQNMAFNYIHSIEYMEHFWGAHNSTGYKHSPCCQEIPNLSPDNDIGIWGQVSKIA